MGRIRWVPPEDEAEVKALSSLPDESYSSSASNNENSPSSAPSSSSTTAATTSAVPINNRTNSSEPPTQINHQTWPPTRISRERLLQVHDIVREQGRSLVRRLVDDNVAQAALIARRPVGGDGNADGANPTRTNRMRLGSVAGRTGDLMTRAQSVENAFYTQLEQLQAQRGQSGVFGFGFGGGSGAATAGTSLNAEGFPVSETGSAYGNALAGLQVIADRGGLPRANPPGGMPASVTGSAYENALARHRVLADRVGRRRANPPGGLPEWDDFVGHPSSTSETGYPTPAEFAFGGPGSLPVNPVVRTSPPENVYTNALADLRTLADRGELPGHRRTNRPPVNTNSSTEEYSNAFDRARELARLTRRDRDRNIPPTASGADVGLRHDPPGDGSDMHAYHANLAALTARHHDSPGNRPGSHRRQQERRESAESDVISVHEFLRETEGYMAAVAIPSDRSASPAAPDSNDDGNDGLRAFVQSRTRRPWESYNSPHLGTLGTDTPSLSPTGPRRSNTAGPLGHGQRSEARPHPLNQFFEPTTNEDGAEPIGADVPPTGGRGSRSIFAGVFNSPLALARAEEALDDPHYSFQRIVDEIRRIGDSEDLRNDLRQTLLPGIGERGMNLMDSIGRNLDAGRADAQSTPRTEPSPTPLRRAGDREDGTEALTTRGLALMQRTTNPTTTTRLARDLAIQSRNSGTARRSAVRQDHQNALALLRETLYPTNPPPFVLRDIRNSQQIQTIADHLPPPTVPTATITRVNRLRLSPPTNTDFPPLPPVPATRGATRSRNPHRTSPSPSTQARLSSIDTLLYSTYHRLAHEFAQLPITNHDPPLTPSNSYALAHLPSLSESAPDWYAEEMDRLALQPPARLAGSHGQPTPENFFALQAAFERGEILRGGNPYERSGPQPESQASVEAQRVYDGLFTAEELDEGGGFSEEILLRRICLREEGERFRERWESDRGPWGMGSGVVFGSEGQRLFG